MSSPMDLQQMLGIRLNTLPWEAHASEPPVRIELQQGDQDGVQAAKRGGARRFHQAPGTDVAGNANAGVAYVVDNAAEASDADPSAAHGAATSIRAAGVRDDFAERNSVGRAVAVNAAAKRAAAAAGRHRRSQPHR